MVFLGVVVSTWLTAMKNMAISDIDCPNGTFESSGLLGKSESSSRWEPIAYMSAPLSGNGNGKYVNMVYCPTPTDFSSVAATLDVSGSITYGNTTIRDMQVWGQFIYTV